MGEWMGVGCGGGGGTGGQIAARTKTRRALQGLMRQQLEREAAERAHRAQVPEWP